MNKDFGYLIITTDNDTTDYISLAYALAISIKLTQPSGYNKVALVVDDKAKVDKLTSPWVFDTVIENTDLPKNWDCRSYMDVLSPFEYTVCLDADMLFFRDFSHWIDYFVDNCDLYVANNSYNYRGDIVTSDFYRKTFTANKLPNLYSFYTFWKRNTELANEFFDLGRKIIEFPEQFSNYFLSKYKPKIVGTDEAFALSAKILDIADEISYPLDFPKVVHMKGMVQDWPWPTEQPFSHVGFYLNRHANLKIGNYQQTDIVHYVDKSKITLEVINILEENLWKI